MKTAPLPTNESERLERLYSYGVLDTDPEACYDDLTKIASEICQTPIALVSLIDKDRQWFKSRQGLDADQTPRDLAFCAHAILEQQLFLVEDTLDDERFYDNPLVTDAPSIRFYAGTPLMSADGYPLGTLCVIDQKPRELSGSQIEALEALGRQVSSQLQLRLHSKKLQELSDLRERLLAMLSHDLRASFTVVMGFAKLLVSRIDKMNPESVSDAAGRIEHATIRAHELLESILEWSQQQSNEHQDGEEVQIRVACENVIDTMSSVALNKNISLNLECPADSRIWVNRCLLASALQNLLSNAIKFSHPNDHIDILVVEDDERLSITVADHGVGMSPELASKIYNEDDLHSSKGTQGETGTGVGTLLVKNFIANAGGDLHVDTAVNAGCRVRLSLPRDQRQD